MRLKVGLFVHKGGIYWYVKGEGTVLGIDNAEKRAREIAEELIKTKSIKMLEKVTFCKN